jgi:hypothetical protein
VDLFSHQFGLRFTLRNPLEVVIVMDDALALLVDVADAKLASIN